MFDGSIIEYYQIQKYDDGPMYLDDSGRDSFWDSFGDWWEDHDYDDLSGTHIGVSDNISGGRATSPGASWVDSAFATSRRAVSGASYSNDNRTSQVAVHEALHTVVNRYLDEVDEMIENESDHDLGDLFMVGHEEGAGSPLLGGYGSEHWGSGDCSEDIAEKVEYWTDMNSCEHKATEATAANDYDA